MNDRYLFRAKRTDNGEWITWNIFWGITNVVIARISQDTISQCTGLKDNNGKLIWENDIVRHYNNPNTPEQFDIGVIKFDNNDCCFKRSSIQYGENYYIKSYCEYEVIGNIFDNPELLEGES